MARTFKSLLGDDLVNSRTLLHEAIPITGTIASGTYMVAGTGDDGMTDANVKAFSHGMFQSVYDYPYLSSSANHIFDLSFGVSRYVSTASTSTTPYAQASKKRNIYDQMAQVLMGYDISGSVRNFDSDGEISALSTDSGVMNHCFFMNFSRLLSKDEIKKNSLRLQLFTSGTVTHNGYGRGLLETLGDYKSANEYRTSPAGDYGLLFTSSAGVVPASDVPNSDAVGLVFYQAGIAVITSSVFRSEFSTNATRGGLAATTITGALNKVGFGISGYQTGSTIDNLANGFRHCIYDIDFNNTIELNSAIYFCRVNHNEFNYSSNPTYVSGSKLRVKNNVTDLPLSYITTVGLYSPDNELLAVAKLSEPIRKDPNTELTLRVRLDY